MHQRSPEDPKFYDEQEDLGWMTKASCRGINPELFYPERGESVKEAKAVCAECDASEECLNYALAHGEKFGIWGGKSERERRRIRRQRALAKRQAVE